MEILVCEDLSAEGLQGFRNAGDRIGRTIKCSIQRGIVVTAASLAVSWNKKRTARFIAPVRARPGKDAEELHFRSRILFQTALWRQLPPPRGLAGPNRLDAGLQGERLYPSTTSSRFLVKERCLDGTAQTP